MLAKSFQVLTKFLILASIASSAAASTVFTPISATNGVRTDMQSTPGVVTIGINLAKAWSGRLSYEDQQTHISAVLFAMLNADHGEIVQWSNPSTDSAGKIVVTVSFPVQGGVCRRYFSQLRIKEKIREFDEQGCKTMDSRFWQFSGR